jgi:hypothetical protein
MGAADNATSSASTPQERLRPPEERESPEAGEEDTRQKESYIDDTVIEAYGNLLHSLQQRTRRVSDRITRVQGASMTGVFKSATDAKTRWKNWAKKATAARDHVGNIKRLRRTMEHTGRATDVRKRGQSRQLLDCHS